MLSAFFELHCWPVGQYLVRPHSHEVLKYPACCEYPVCCEVSSLLRVSGLQRASRLVAGIGQLGLRTEPFTHKVVQGLPCLSSTEANPFQPAGRRGLPTTPPTKLPTTFSLKLLIVSSSKTWAGVLADKSQEVPRLLDRSQGRTANLQQKEFCLSLGHLNAFSSSDHVTPLRAGLSS